MVEPGWPGIDAGQRGFNVVAHRHSGIIPAVSDGCSSGRLCRSAGMVGVVREPWGANVRIDVLLVIQVVAALGLSDAARVRRAGVGSPSFGHLRDALSCR